MLILPLYKVILFSTLTIHLCNIIYTPFFIFQYILLKIILIYFLNFFLTHPFFSFSFFIQCTTPFNQLIIIICNAKQSPHGQISGLTTKPTTQYRRWSQKAHDNNGFWNTAMPNNANRFVQTWERGMNKKRKKKKIYKSYSGHLKMRDTVAFCKKLNNNNNNINCLLFLVQR